MTKRYFESDIDDDLHMGNVSDKPGYTRGTLYDKDNSLQTHAEFRELSEEEMRERFSEPVDQPIDYDLYDYDYRNGYQEESSLTPEQRENLNRLGDALGDLAYGFLSRLFSNALDEATVRGSRWWNESGAPAARRLKNNARSFIAGFRGKDTRLKADEVLAEHGSKLAKADGKREHEANEAEAVLGRINASFDEYTRNITSEEAQRELLQIIYDASVLSMRINRLATANVVDDNASQSWQDVSNLLTEQSLIDGVNRILSGNAKLLDPSQIASFEMLLGRELYHDGAYVPIDAVEYRQRLTQGGFGPSRPPERREDEGTDAIST